MTTDAMVSQTDLHAIAKKLKLDESFAESGGRTRSEEDHRYSSDYEKKLLVLDAKKDDLVFQAIHLEDCEEEGEGYVDVYGVTEDGCPVLLTLRDFHPYFYIAAPDGFTTDDCGPFEDYLNGLLRGGDGVCDISLHSKRISDAAAPAKICIRIVLTSPSRMEELKEFQYRGLFHIHLLLTYGCDVPFLSRFMADTGITPMTWVKVPAGKYRVIDPDNKVSILQVEARANYEDVKTLSETERQHLGLPQNAPLRVLSFDIETMVPRDNSFPKPSTESVIQISSVVARRCYPTNEQPEDPFFRCVFTLNTCAEIPNCTIFSFNNEADLLKEWRKFMVKMDPDVIMGHNMLRFDFPYLLLRAKQLGIRDFGMLGRLAGVVTTYDHPFQGIPNGWVVAPFFPGRISIDSLHWANANVPSGRTLDVLAHRYLGEGKDGINFKQIVTLQNGNAETRRRLAQYCLKASPRNDVLTHSSDPPLVQDALLVLKLVDTVRCVQQFYIPSACQSLVSLNSVVSMDCSLGALKTFQEARGQYIIADRPALRKVALASPIQLSASTY